MLVTHITLFVTLGPFYQFCSSAALILLFSSLKKSVYLACTVQRLSTAEFFLHQTTSGPIQHHPLASSIMSTIQPFCNFHSINSHGFSFASSPYLYTKSNCKILPTFHFSLIFFPIISSPTNTSQLFLLLERLKDCLLKAQPSLPATGG